MPPVPPFAETAIPGSTVAFSPSAQLYTHSNKFPIERQITLSSTEKNFKIPILNDLKKRSKGAVIAPDAPPKRLTAWTRQEPMQPHSIYPDQTHAGLPQTIQQIPDPIIYRASYIPEVELYGNHTAARETQKSIQQTNEYQLPEQPHQPLYQTPQKRDGTEQEEKLTPKNSRGVTKTYHTLKDIISGKFRGKDVDKQDNAGLNNTPEIMKKPLDNVVLEMDPTRLGAGQAYPTASEPHQYNQHVVQQNIVQPSHQYYTQQLRNQQQYSHLIQPRTQDAFKHRPDDQMQYQAYGNKAFLGSPGQAGHQFQKPADGFQTPENEAQIKADFQNHAAAAAAFERRSAQQIERDHLKQINLETRRTLSHPHLLLDGEGHDANNGSHQKPVNARRGSLGNILDPNMMLPNHHNSSSQDHGKESDDGGFLNRNGPKVKYANQPIEQKDSNVQGAVHEINKGRVIESAQVELKRRAENDGGEKERGSSNIDSGRGSAAYSSGRRPPLDDVTDTARISPRDYEEVNEQENDSEWVDIVEKELRHILEPKLLELSMQGNHGITRSALSGSISSITPPLPPLSGGDNLSPTITPKPGGKFKGFPRDRGFDCKGRLHSRDIDESTKTNKYSNKIDYHTALRGKQIFGLDSTDFTSTTTRSLDLESILDGQSDSDANLSVADTKAIRKQLEGLENMYSEVLKFLGVNKRVTPGRYQPSDPRIHKKRHGSMSSLPSSSVSSVRRDRRYVRGGVPEERRDREPRTTARRFQRLEAHVVTLARSVAHLSSEMRTQHLVVQEIESVRQEVAALRAQANMLNIRSQSARPVTSLELPSLANPSRVKKLTKFFGDEPPLLRLFLRKLGYEKYANAFENEKIGMVELPYLTEERLQKMGVSLGPRLRIMQEAQISVYKDNTLCIV
uniref:SAM domain-containing protein n=2 Tax=Dendroctonus ponderosae TaxID=77166 RepID=A0AAR5P8J9_DENPD